MNAVHRALITSFLGCLLHAAPGTYRIDTIAGSSSVGDGGPALRAPLRDAQGVATDRAGNIYIADAGDHRIRKVTPGGIITTLAGTGVAGLSGDDGPAAAAKLNLPYGVAVDAAGIVYIADLGNNRIRKVAIDGTISSIAQTFQSPRNVLIDSSGNLFVSEFGAHRIRRISANGTVVTVAGTGAPGRTGDYGPAVAATLNSPAGMAFDSGGALYFADSGNSMVRKISGGVITPVLGTGTAGDSLVSQLNYPTGVSFDAFGNLYVADFANARVRKLTPAGNVLTIFYPARDVAIDSAGNLLIASGEHVTKVLVSGAVAVVAGDGSYFVRGDGGPAVEARLNAPSAVAVDSAGILTIADTANGRIRAVSTSGIISTVTSSALLTTPAALAFDSSRNLLIADPAKAAVWNLSPPTFSMAAGNGSPGFNGDGAPAVIASLARPSGLAVIPSGGFYLADTGNSRVRRVNAGGTISTVAGISSSGWNGDGIALGASLSEPTALALDAKGNLFVADTYNNAIRKLSLDGQLITVLGGQKTGLTLRHPRGLTLDPAGTLWIADTDNHRILTLSPDGVVTIVAGNGSPGFGGDGGATLDASFSSPSGLASDSNGNIYIADTGNNRIRILIAPPAPVVETTVSGYAVVGAASLQSGVAAPCSLITIFGADADTAPLAFDGVATTAVSTSPGQATVQVPCTVALPATALSVGTWRASLPIENAAPALFALNAGSGQALALNSDATPNSEVNPARAGSIVSLFATGMGLPGNAAGVIVGGSTADILFQGDAPGFIGITQMNIQLPVRVAGVQRVIVLSANIASQTAVTLAIQ